MTMLRHAGLSDLGRVRTENEDRWLGAPGRGVFVVADGMGGRSAGALAAQVVVETLPDLLDQRLQGIEDVSQPEAGDLVQSALKELSEQLQELSAGQPGLDGMGATVVAALIRGNKALIAHMGDSRAYLLRQGQLERLTRDHSLVQLLLDNGEIAPEEAAAHPSRTLLTRYVGMPGEALPEVRLLTVQGGDRLLLCSDGLSGMVADGEIQGILQEQPSPEAACTCLIAAANAAGGKDNITAVLVAIESEQDSADQAPTQKIPNLLDKPRT